MSRRDSHLTPHTKTTTRDNITHHMKRIAIFVVVATVWLSQSYLRCAAFFSTRSSSNNTRRPVPTAAWLQGEGLLLHRRPSSSTNSFVQFSYRSRKQLHVQWHGAGNGERSLVHSSSSSTGSTSSSSSSSSSRKGRRLLSLAMSTSTNDNQDETKNDSSKLLAAIRSIDIPLLVYFAAWYLGNYFVSILHISFSVAS